MTPTERTSNPSAASTPSPPPEQPPVDLPDLNQGQPTEDEKLLSRPQEELVAQLPYGFLDVGSRGQSLDQLGESLANGRGQSFIGASPERLVRVAGGRMHTEALAGSAPRGESASEGAAFAQAP